VLRAEIAAGVAHRILTEVKEIVPQYQWQQTNDSQDLPSDVPGISPLYVFDIALANAHD